MFQRQMKWLLGAAVLATNAVTLHAQMAQDPLLSRTAAVEPNIVFIFDDSASMVSTAIYQYGGGAGYQGSRGPNDDAECLAFTAGCIWTNPPTSLYGQSPDVNLIYYDPRVIYKLRINPDGTSMAAGSTAGISSWKVYFYQPATITRYTVDTVPVTAGGGGFSSSVTGSFPAPPAGGTQATATVQTGIRYSVTGVNVTNGGYGYASTVGALFTDPPAGGTTATADVVTTDVFSATGFNYTSRGTGFPATGVTASFNAPPAGGVQATVSSVTTQLTNKLLSVTPTAGSSGSCSNSVSATVSAPNIAGGIQASVTPVRAGGGGSRPIVSFTINNAGSGYTTAPTITFSNCGTNPTYTALLTPTYILDTLTIGAAGAGYTSPPVLTINPGTGTAYTVSVNTASTKKITGFTITDPGAGYTSPPALSLTSPGAGVNFAGTVVSPSTRAITGVTVTNGGSGYLTAPVLTLANTGGGSGSVLAYNYLTTVTGGVNKQWDGVGNPLTAADYFSTGSPAGYTPDAGSPLAASATLLPYPNVTGSGFTYPKFRNRTDCAGNVCTWAEERQNFANWKRYHSNRLDLAKTGIGLAFQPLNPTFRLGWGTLGQISNQGSTSSACGASTAALAQGVQLYNSGTQSAFLTWLYAINGNVLCTPSRVALDNVGKYYQRADAGGPWANSPAGSGTISVAGIEAGHASCRRSYSMLMTDGYYNDTFSLGGTGDADSTSGPNISQPRAYQYNPIGPYSDNITSTTKYLNTLADVAMKYWVNDLRPDLSNGVKPVTGDEAFWQHMNFYAIGLGLVGTLDANDPTVLQKLSGNSPVRTLSWPTPVGNDPKAIDDMWHATINGRGKLLNAKTADELNSSIQQMMSDIGGKEGTQSGVAVSTISLTKDTRKYTPSYTPISWTGNVVAYNLDQNNANQSTIAWQVETLVSIDPLTGAKTYSSRIPSPASRNIFVGNGATSGTRAIPFDTSMPAGLITAMGGGATSGLLINYLRGDKTNEDNNASVSSATAIYRGRQTMLGDVVNSTPVFVKDTLDMKYDLLPAAVTGQSSYAAFVAAKKARTEGVLFVGANDGMLHAFRDGTYGANDVSLTPGGIEVFAYVPNALLPTLVKLSDKAYVHQYYVDGPNSETDAYLASKSAWTNIVLGSTGAGAGAPSSAGVSPRTAVFALDVTSLNTSPAGMDASSVLWEVGSGNASFAELGYVLTDIQAGVTVGGQWVAIFGNGYESKSCQARLFVVNLDTGALIREINTGAGSCAAGSRNGLGGVRLVRNSSQQVVGVYAGDLLGNMWKFNLNNTSSASWGVDLSAQPLMKAGVTQPITAAPSVLALPMIGTSDPKPGYMVVFGTGKFYEVPDISTTTQQSLYGIWDKLDFGAAVIPAGSALTSTTSLVQQTITAAIAGTNGNNYFSISSNAVDYTSATPKRGWFINMPNTGQRLVYPLDILADRFAVADTISPANVSVDPCSNLTGGVGFLYIVDALNGGGPTRPILDTNGDGNVDATDMVVSGLEGTADGRNVSIVVSRNDLAITYANVGGGTPGATLIKIGCELTNTCSVPSPGVRHQWRQLFLR